MHHTRTGRRAPMDDPLRALLVCCALSIMSIRTAAAQELEPRAYSASPIGLNFVVVSAVRSTGGVLVDPSLPVEDVEATVDSVAIGAGRTVNVFGRTALLVGAVPYAWADASGNLAEQARRISRTGLTDPRFKVSVNLVGGRALTPREFARTSVRTIVGVSLAFAAPLGQYERTKLINLGANRWTFKPEVGVSRIIGRWTIEGYAGVWLFTTNDEFYAGASIRTQQPIAALQAHASYTVRPRLWAAADATWYSGGTTSVNGVSKGDLQRNSRIGASLSLPFTRQQSLKFAASMGATTRIGADFRTVAVAWQFAWFD